MATWTVKVTYIYAVLLSSWSKIAEERWLECGICDGYFLLNIAAEAFPEFIFVAPAYVSYQRNDNASKIGIKLVRYNRWKSLIFVL